MARNVPKSSNRTRIGEDWQPSDVDRAFASGLGLDAERIERVAEHFKDWHLSHGSLMASWPAAWRLWCRNEAKWARSRAQRSLALVAVVADPSDPYGAKKWAETLPDRVPDTIGGAVVMAIGGFDVVGTAVDVCRVAGLQPEWRGELTHIADWLRDGFEPEHIVAVIRASSRPRTPGSWWWYDEKVRGRRISK